MIRPPTYPNEDDPWIRTMVCGERLAAVRQALGLSVQDVARECDLHVVVVQAMEAGQEPITVEDLWNLARVLRMHPSRLLMSPEEDRLQQSAYWLLEQATKKAGQREQARLLAAAAQATEPLDKFALAMEARKVAPGRGIAVPTCAPEVPTPFPPPPVFVSKKGVVYTR